MKIKYLLIGVIFIPLAAQANEEVNFKKIHQAFPLAAQGHASNSKLTMNGESKIIGTQVYTKKGTHKVGEGHLNFANEAINGADGGYCYADSNAKRETCSVTKMAGPDYYLGAFNPPDFAYKTFDLVEASITKSPKEVFNGGSYEFEGGEYYLSKLDVNNNAQVTVTPGSGDVTLYVQGKVTINGNSIVGSPEQNINIVSYGANALDLNNGSTLYGGITTNGSVEINGTSKVRLYGSLRAKKVDFDVATLELGAGNHWLDSLDINNKAKFELTDSGFTVLHIKDSLQINGGVTFNAPAKVKDAAGQDKDKLKSLLMLSYSTKEVLIDNDTKVYGYIYANGPLTMNNAAEIHGAVNVKDINMNGKALINYNKLFYEESESVYNYRLDFDSTAETLQTSACKDNSACENKSNYYDGLITKLNISDKLQDEKSLVNYDAFTQTSAIANISLDEGQCVQFMIAGSNTPNDKTGANPWPTATPPLQCFMDGVKISDCYVCDNPVPLYGYVYGDAIIPQLSKLAKNPFTITEYDGPAGLKTSITEDNSTSTPLTVGSTFETLPLTVTHNEPSDITLTIEAADQRRYVVELAFVPKYFKWVNKATVAATNPTTLDLTAECIDGDNGFVYTTKNATCSVVGKVGDDVDLILQIYGQEANNGEMQIINDYAASLGKIVKVQELDAQTNPNTTMQDLFNHFNFLTAGGAGHNLNYTSEKVSLIQASIETHCAPYGMKRNGECPRPTKGDTAIVGRTVPERLVASEALPGAIQDDVAYRGKPIEFIVTPEFEVAACKKGQLTPEACDLPSYRGEFAQGLTEHSTLVPSQELRELGLTESDLKVALKEITESDQPFTGRHAVTLALSDHLVAEKRVPVPETQLEGELTLNVAAHDRLTSVESSTPFVKEGTKLRFGYLAMEDLELPFSSKGHMTGKLFYYDEGKLPQLADDSHFSFAQDIKNQGVTEELSVIAPAGANLAESQLEDRGIFFSEYSANASDGFAKQQRDFNVTLPGSAKWLKTYEPEQGLVAPNARLTIGDRKRGHDRVFNRREALQ